MIKRLSKAVFFAVILAAPLSYTAAQAPQSSSEAAKELPREFPAPRNLKVLPKNLNGRFRTSWKHGKRTGCQMRGVP